MVYFVLVITVVILVTWWISIRPSNDRLWADDVVHTVTAEISNNEITLFNVRNFTWRTETDYDQLWETRHYKLDQLSSVDLFLSNWGKKLVSHTLVSFGFNDGRYITFSFEIRKERGEKFSEIAGFFKQYELALIAADERDIIRTRTNPRKEDVTRYRVHLNEEDRRKFFLSYLERANKLAKEPAFYNTLTANCTTVLFQMMRVIVPSIPLDYRVLVSGLLPAYIYDLGGFGEGETLEQLTAKGKISEIARNIPDDENFSIDIRKNISISENQEK